MSKAIIYVNPNDVDREKMIQISTGLPVIFEGIGKMSKSKNNGVDIGIRDWWQDDSNLQETR